MRPLTAPPYRPRPRRRGARRLGVVVAALCAAAAFPSAAPAAWQQLGPISKQGGDSASPQFAAAPDGGVMAVWRRRYEGVWRVEARLRSADGELSPVQFISPRGTDAFDPAVAVDGAGTAVFTWRASDGSNSRVEARVRSAGGNLGDVVMLSAAGLDALDPRVGVDDVGDAAFAWRRWDGANWRVEGRWRTAAGTVTSPIYSLSAVGQDALDPGVAVSSTSGRAVFVWRRFDGSNWRVEERASGCCSAGTTTVTAVRSLSAAGRDALDPGAAIADPGSSDPTARVVWRRFDGSNWRVQSRDVRVTTGGVLNVVQGLSAAGRDALEPRVARWNGSFAEAWRRFDGAHWRVEVQGQSGGEQTASGSGQDALDVQLASAGAGPAALVWRRFDGSAWRAQLRILSAAGALSPVQTLSPAGQDVFDPRVALDADGSSLAGWRRAQDGLDRIEGRPRSASGQLTPTVALSEPIQSSSDAKLAVGSDGSAAFAWLYDDGSGAGQRVQGRVRAPDGTWSDVLTLSAPHVDSHFAVAMDAYGDAAWAWSRFDGQNYRLQIRTLRAGVDLSPVQTLSPAGQDALGAAIVYVGTQSAVAAWYDPRGDAYVGQRPAGGTLPDAQRIGPGTRPVLGSDGAGHAMVAYEQPGQGTFFRILEPGGWFSTDYEPVAPSSTPEDLAVNGHGDTAFALIRNDGSHWLSDGRTRLAGGAYSPLQQLSQSGYDAFGQRAALDGSGNALFAWYRYAPQPQVEARALSAGGTLGPIEPIAPAGTSDPVLAMTPAGEAFFAWETTNLYPNNRVEARVRHADGTLAPPDVLATGTVYVSAIGVDSTGRAVAVWNRVLDASANVWSVEAATGP